MASLQIRDLPDDIYETLSHRASKEGRSLAQQAIAELRELPELKARQRRLETLHRIRDRLSTDETRAFVPAPEDLIRQDRDR